MKTSIKTFDFNLDAATITFVVDTELAKQKLGIFSVDSLFDVFFFTAKRIAGHTLENRAVLLEQIRGSDNGVLSVEVLENQLLNS